MRKHLPVILMVSCGILLAHSPAFSAGRDNSGGAILYHGTLDGAALTWSPDAGGGLAPQLPGTRLFSETNRPVLTTVDLHILVPPETDLGDIEVVPLQTHLEPLPGPIALGGVLTSDQGEEIVVQRLGVGQNSYPELWGEYAGSHTWRGFRFVSVQLYPLRAIRDAAGNWTAVEVLDRYEIRLLPGDALSPSDTAQRMRLVPGERQRAERMLAQWVVNPEALAGYQRQDGVVVPEPTGGFQPTRTPALSGSAVSYLIITSDMLADEFQLLADHKTSLGLPAVVATTEWIEANYRHGCDIQQTMRMFIRDAYEKWGVEWVLLGGDTNVLPARYGVNTYYPPQGFTEIPVDMYFSCLDGNWNADGDYVFGEEGDECDMADEVFLGRAPVSDEVAATVFVDKVISYEQTAAGDAWANRVLFAAEMLFPQIWQQGMPITLDGAIFAEELVDSLIVPCTDLEYTRMYENHWDYTGSVPLTREAFIDSLNTGHYGICNQTGHGFFFNMSVGDANFTNADADALFNENPFLIYALNCASAAFDKACLMERLLQNPNGGSMVSIGSSRAAFPYTTHRYQMRFFRHLYCLSANQPGELIFLSKMPRLSSTYWEGADRWTFMVYTLLGDPALRIWTGSPEAAQVSAPATLSTGAQNVTITVTSGGAPMDSALVCLTKTGEDYAYDWTDPAGQVSLPFTPTSGGDAVLTVTGTDLEFTQSSIPVTPTSTYVAVVEISFVDDGTDDTAGNGNGIPEAGETVAMYIHCQDTGGGGASNCSASLSSSEPGVIMISDTATVGDVPPAGTKWSDEPFVFQLDASVINDGTLIPFDIVVTDASNSYQNEWTVTALAPEIEPVDLVWSDSLYGNDNGVIEDGERVTVTAFLKNFGAGLADFVTGTLRTDDPQVTLHDSVVTYQDIALLERSTGDGAFSLTDSDVSTESWCWILFADNYARTVRHDFRLHVPAVPDGLKGDTTAGPDVISLRWLPVQEEGLRGYHVYRSDEPGGSFSRVNVDLVDGISYFRDDGLAPLTRYYYYVTSVDSSLVEGPASAVLAQSTAPPEKSGFPLPFAMETSGHCAVGDVTGNGSYEIVLGADKIYVWTAAGGELFDGDHNAQTHGPISAVEGEFQPAGITLAQLDGVLGLEIIASRKDSCQIYIFRHDGTILPGWPQDLLYNVDKGWNWATPAVGDVDGDGESEIVVYTQDGRIWVWHVNGTELRDGDNDPATNGVFVVLDEQYGKSSPALFDLDGDGAKEIIFGTHNGVGVDNYLLAYRYDGTQAVGFPYYVGTGNIQCSVTVADLDLDGVWEIVFQSQNDVLFVVRQDGSDYPEFPLPFLSNTGFAPSPAVGDFDQDGELEIVAISTTSSLIVDIYVFDTDVDGGTSGQPLPGWPQPLPGNSEGSPVVGDIDGDGLLDVIHGIGGGNEGSPDALYAFKANGEPVDGYPISLGGPARASAVICDLDRNGDAEIVFGSGGREIHVWDMPYGAQGYDATKVPWPTFRGHVFRDGVHRPESLVAVPPGRVVPEALSLSPPYPNPFNPATTVKLYLPGAEGTSQPLQLVIYDLRGRKVRVLHEGPARAGWNSWIWDGRNEGGGEMASGVYFLRAHSDAGTMIQKMALIK